MRRLLAATFVVTVVLSAGYGAASAAIWYQTSDFFCLWNGANFVVTARDPYDESAWLQAVGGLYPDPRGGNGTSACPGRFAYPLWTAVVLAPFGALPLELAATLWMALAIAATLGGTYLAWRAAALRPAQLPFLLALVLFSQPFWVLLDSGQLSGVMLALAATVSWAVSTRRDGAGGAALGAIALKPQIGALFVPFVLVYALASGRRRLVLAAVGTGALLLLVSLLVAPGWPVVWFAELTGRRLRNTPLLPTAWGLAADLTGTPAFGALFIVAVVAAVFFVGGRAAFAGLPLIGVALALSLFVTPYVWSYDFLVLTVPWAITLAFIDRMRGLRRVVSLVGLVVAASLLPWTLYAIAFSRGGETWSAVVPPATALLLAGALASAPRGAAAGSA